MSTRFPPCVQVVASFDELLGTPFQGEVNALCWARSLSGDFAQVVRLLGPPAGVTEYDEATLRALPLDAAGRLAVDVIVGDLRLLAAYGRDPVFNGVNGYPRDDDAGPFATDVMSFHADSAPVPAETWLCTYFGAATEGLPHNEAERRVDIPASRAQLLARWGGDDDEGFRSYLQTHSYDLHYLPFPTARPWSFGVGHLWRIAVAWPGCPVPPCLHRAPDTAAPRLLLIC